MSPLKPQATYDDFARLGIRIGKVVEVQPFPRARNPSYKVGVDVGAGRTDARLLAFGNVELATLPDRPGPEVGRNLARIDPLLVGRILGTTRRDLRDRRRRADRRQESPKKNQ